MAEKDNQLPKSLAERIREANKAAGDKSIVSEESLVEFITKLQKDRSDNTIIEKMKRSLKKSYREKTDPYRLMKSLTPKAFTGLNKKLDSLMSQREAELELDAIRNKKATAEKKAIKDYLDEMVASNAELQNIAKEQGKVAARTAALIMDEQKAIQEADENFVEISKQIHQRFLDLEKDARAEYFRRKGIQLVKIVEDKPNKEVLLQIKEDMHKNLVLQKKQAEEEYTKKKDEARLSRVQKEEIIKDKKWKSALLNLGGLLKPAKSEGGIFDFLLNMLFSKGGLITLALAGLGTVLYQYLKDSDFAGVINGVVGETATIVWDWFKDTILIPLKEKIVAVWDSIPLRDKILLVTASLSALALYVFSKIGPIIASQALSAAMFKAAAAIELASKRILAAAGGPNTRGGPGMPAPDLPDGPDKDKGKQGKGKQQKGGNSSQRRKAARALGQVAEQAGKGAIKEGGEVAAKKGLAIGLSQLAKRGLVAAGGLLVPGAGWAMTAAQIGWLAYDIYDLMKTDETSVPEEGSGLPSGTMDLEVPSSNLEIPDPEAQVFKDPVRGDNVVIGGSNTTNNNVNVTPAMNPYDLSQLGLLNLNPFSISP